MPGINKLPGSGVFSEILYGKMKQVSSAIAELEPYEFRYCLNKVAPENGWEQIEPDHTKNIERLISGSDFYRTIQTKPKIDGRIALDRNILHLTHMLFVGLVCEDYPVEWVKAHFYFDIRGFIFFCRSVYFTDPVVKHFSGKPYRSFTPEQKQFERLQDVGYKDFMHANAEIDQAFIDIVMKLIHTRGTPILLTLAGPTAAGKTEIVDRLLNSFTRIGKKITTIEMDNFLIDRDCRGESPMGKATTHFELFKHSLKSILQGNKTAIPRYDFINATSSHDLDGTLRTGCTPIVVEPADIIFIEGNFPFQMKEISDLIGVKVVYLTDDPVRLKRKWKRDIDYRKKYIPNYFLNRFFQTQFLRAEDCYRPQMEVCDIVVDTTGAALWVTPEIAKTLNLNRDSG